MSGPFRPTNALSVGLLWKSPWRLSTPRKLRQRRRLRKVDNIISVLDTALQRLHLRHDPAFSPRDSVLPNIHTTKEALTLRSLRGPKMGAILPPYPIGTHVGLRGEIITTGQAAESLGTIKKLERWKADMPKENEMVARDKYTMFDRKERGYRKGIHKSLKWTRCSQRINPPGF